MLWLGNLVMNQDPQFKSTRVITLRCRSLSVLIFERMFPAQYLKKSAVPSVKRGSVRTETIPVGLCSFETGGVFLNDNFMGKDKSLPGDSPVAICPVGQWRHSRQVCACTYIDPMQGVGYLLPPL